MSGFLIGLTFTLKPPIFIASALVYFIFLSIISFINKDKKYPIYCLVVIVSACIPVAICMIWVVVNHCMDEFMTQVFFSGSKGSIFDIIIVSIKTFLKNNFVYASLAANIILALMVFREDVIKAFSKIKKPMIFMMCASLLFSVAVVCYTTIVRVFFVSVNTSFIGILMITLFLTVISYILRKKQYIIFSYVLIAISALIPFLYVYYNVHNISSELYDNTSLFTLSSTGISSFCLFFLVLFSIETLYDMKHTPAPELLPKCMLLAGAIAESYATLMTARDYIASYTAYYIVTLMLTILLSEKIYFNKIKNYIVYAVCLIMCMSCLSQKVIRAYSWWGWSDANLSEKKYAVDVKGLEGYRLSEHEKTMYEEVVKLIEYNTDSDSTILGFPHMTIFNVLTNRPNINWFVPVLFYDVCSDDAAISAAEAIKEMPPDIVIWADIPSCMEVHESIFRNGAPLGQREIQNWFIDAKDRSYTLIGQIGNLFIYRYNDGTKINYTYIENPDAINTTATRVE